MPPVHTQQTPRERFISDIRNPSARPINIPYKEMGHYLDKLGKVAPLVSLTSEEKQIAIETAKHGLEVYWKETVGKANQLLSREYKIRWPETQAILVPESDLVAQMFSDWKTAKAEGVCTCATGVCTKFRAQYHVSRDLGDIKKETGMDILPIAYQALLANRGKIIALDFGCGNGAALSDLKSNFGPNVETHGLSLLEEPRAPMHAEHNFIAELLPESFRGKYNLVYSHRTLEYIAMPHIAIRNMLHSLAGRGIAYAQWVDNSFSGNGVNGLLNDYLPKHLKEMHGKLKNATNSLVAAYRSAFERITEEGSVTEKRALAYYAEVDSIAQLSGIRVTYSKPRETCIGTLPELIAIHKK